MVCWLKKHLSLFRGFRLYLLIIIVMLFVRMSFGYFSESVKLYVNQKSRAYAEEIIAHAIEEDVVRLYDSSLFIKRDYNLDSELSSISLDPYYINLLRSDVSKTLQEKIKMINKQEEFESLMIPLGYFFSRNYFLANGIRVPINLEIIGSVKTDVDSDIKSYGINSSLITIYLDVSIQMQIMIPFQQDIVNISYKIPICMEIINSDIPFFCS